jgi:ATP phosphoribosyltransferase regulatory subunit
MTQTPALLPAGLRDILPPFAAHEADTAARLMEYFAHHGYERVKPPLIEFEETLFAGSGADMSRHSFRLMDPDSQRMLAVRADMTLQVGRIAITRLTNTPRPLRLSYAGQVLWVKGTQLRPERQFGQTGIELIGADSAAADAEVILAAAGALTEIGIGRASVDLTLPSLIPLIHDGRPISEELRHALDHKDVAKVQAIGGPLAANLVALIEAAGPAERALQRLAPLDLHPGVTNLRERLSDVVRRVKQAQPDLILTVDPVENRGFEYHVGIAFSLFAQGYANELGRGGRYFLGDEPVSGEPATGATLFMDTVLEAAPGPTVMPRLFVPASTPYATSRDLRKEGWIVIVGLDPGAASEIEARRLGCSHLFKDGRAMKLA